jgi:putative SOS response-associated peptidase YedK
MPQSMATTKNPTRESPNDLLADVHDRTPVILSAEHYDRWLDPGIHALESVLALLMPYDSALIRRYP